MNKKGFTLFLSVILIIATMAAIVSASDWSQFQKDEFNTGRTDDSAPITAPNNWSHHTAHGIGQGIDVVPIVVGEYIYVLASNANDAYLFKYYKNGSCP